MAEAGRVNLPAAPKVGAMILAEPVTVVRAAIIVFILLFWEAIAQSGLLYRDVVPSLLAIGTAVIRLLSTPSKSDVSSFCICPGSVASSSW